MKPLVVGDDEAGEEDDHHNDCAHHQANHSIVTLNETPIVIGGLTDSKSETYVGLTAGEFKVRWSKHKTSFENQTYKNSTTLSTYIWKLKEQNEAHQVEFEIVGRAAPFSAVSGGCNLCIAEKFEIMLNVC